MQESGECELRARSPEAADLSLKLEGGDSW